MTIYLYFILDSFCYFLSKSNAIDILTQASKYLAVCDAKKTGFDANVIKLI